MSEDESGLSGAILEEVSDQVDVADLLGEGTLDEQVEADEVGASAGATFGERIGRELGTEIGRAVHQAFSESVERGDDLGDLVSEITAAIEDTIREAIGADEDAEAAEEDEDENVEESPEAESRADEATEDAESVEEADSGMEASNLEDLRRETLEDFLEVLSYRDLQSVAKDVGVKANLSREEMTDEIIEAVADDASEAETGDREGENDQEAEAT